MTIPPLDGCIALQIAVPVAVSYVRVMDIQNLVSHVCAVQREEQLAIVVHSRSELSDIAVDDLASMATPSFTAAVHFISVSSLPA